MRSTHFFLGKSGFLAYPSLMEPADPDLAIEETKPYQLVVKPRFVAEWEAKLHRFTYLRSLFALGLGRSSPVSQQEFANWCGVSRKLLTLVETGRTELSRRLADRVRDLTGADYNWLLGANGLKILDFKYLDLASRYPVTMPQTAADLTKQHNLQRDQLTAATSHVVGALCARSRLLTGTGALPSRVTERYAKDFTDVGWEGQCGPAWQAFAFSPSCEALKSAIDWSLLEELPWENGPLTSGMAQKDLAELAHRLTVELGKVERAGEIQRKKC